jgi:hypothetical protein
LLTRYAMMVALGLLALVIGPRAFAGGVFGFVLLAAAALVTRIVYAAPERFANRNATPRLRVVWYVFLAEVVVAATAFALAFDRHGSFAASVAAVVVVIALDVAAARMQHAEDVRTGAVIELTRRSGPDDHAAFTGDAGGPANDALKAALSDVYAHIPTVVRAYLVVSAREDGSDQRILGLRFAYPWIDEDAMRAAHAVFAHMGPPGDSMTVIDLDDRSEARARLVAAPFYERPVPTSGMP